MEWKKVAKTGFGLVLLTALFWVSDIGAIVSSLRKVDLELYTAGVGLFLTTYVAASLRWETLSQTIGYNISFSDSFRIIAISYSFNKLFPGNSGDLVRSKIFERYRGIDSHGRILGIVALERYFTVVSLLSIVAVSLFFFDVPLIGRFQPLLVIFALAGAGFSLVLVLKKTLLERIGLLSPIGSSFLSDVLDGYRSSNRREIGLNMFYSLYIRSAEAVVFYLFVLALSSGIGFWEAAFVTSMMSLVSALPISPGGIGAVEAAGTGMLVALGLGYSSALSLVILQRSVGLVLMALVGVTVYWVEELV